MRITVQTIQSKVTEVECEPTDTVADLKKKLEPIFGFTPEEQNLVFKGAVLKDPMILSEVNVTDGVKLIFFGKKASKPKAAAQPAQPKSEAQPAPAPASQPTPAAQQPSTISPSTETPTKPAPTSESTQPPQPADVSRAGLGSGADTHDEALTNPFAPSAGVSGTGDARAGATGPTASNTPYLEELLFHPQMGAIRQIVQANPSSIPVLVQELSRTQPQLALEIAQNIDAFAAVLNGLPPSAGPQLAAHMRHAGSGATSETDSGDDSSGTGGISSAMDEDAMVQQAMANSIMPTGPGSELSAEDNEKIQQIMSITGASQAAATQAYIVCDKNPDAAINFLFEQ